MKLPILTDDDLNRVKDNPHIDWWARAAATQLLQLQWENKRLRAKLEEIASYETGCLDVENSFAASLAGKARVALLACENNKGPLRSP
jgi:hypothetical protein